MSEVFMREVTVKYRRVEGGKEYADLVAVGNDGVIYEFNQSQQAWVPFPTTLGTKKAETKARRR